MRVIQFCVEFFIQFWSELSLEARQELLRIDKKALFENARKNMCCSKCIGMLLEGFLQIVSNGKSLQQKEDLPCNRSGDQSKVVHRWGGLTATRDGLLTVLDCYLYAKSFKGIQTVSFIQDFLFFFSVGSV